MQASSGKAAATEIDRMCKHPIHVENSDFKHARQRADYVRFDDQPLE